MRTKLTRGASSWVFWRARMDCWTFAITAGSFGSMVLVLGCSSGCLGFGIFLRLGRVILFVPLGGCEGWVGLAAGAGVGVGAGAGMGAGGAGAVGAGFSGTRINLGATSKVE